MPRTLRSGSRQRKLQVQHIQQVNKTLRVNLNKCIAANIDNFNQSEFLSLFGLTQIGMKNGQKAKRDGLRIKRMEVQHTDVSEGTDNASHTAVSPDDFNEALQHRYKLGKWHSTFICCMQFLIAVRISIVLGFFRNFTK